MSTKQQNNYQDESDTAHSTTIDRVVDISALIVCVQCRDYYDQADRDAAVNLLTEIYRAVGPTLTVRQLAVKILEFKNAESISSHMRFVIEALWWALSELYLDAHVNQ